MHVLADSLPTRRDRAVLAAMVIAAAAVPPLAAGARPLSPVNAVALVGLPALAALCFLIAARRQAMDAVHFWLVLAGALLLAACGGGFLALRELGWMLPAETAVPLAASYTAATVLALLGLLISPAAGSSAVGRMRRLVDGGVTAISVFCALWAAGVRPESGDLEAGVTGALAISYPIVDAIMVTLVVQLLVASRTNRVPLLAFTAGLAMIIVANTGFATATNREEELPSWIYPAWGLGFLWLSVGSVAADDRPVVSDEVTRIQSALPYAAAAGGVWATYVWVLMTHEVDSILFTAAFALFLLVLARQSIVARENIRLLVEQQAASARHAEEMARSSAAERENLAIERFLAGMSHEFRTPLNSILGFAELGLTLGLELDPKTRRYLENIQTAGRHMLALVNDVLDLSKVRAGKLDLHLTSVDAVRVANDCLAQMAPLAVQKNVTLRAPGGRRLVIADERRLGQILINLLSNAVKFTPHGGQVTVAVEEIGRDVEIAVADTGIGIAPDDQELIFGEYSQVSFPESGKAAGTGLGLTLSRHLAQLMGGTIRVESAPGHGSTFALRLPKAGG